jgi:hypothetical protein
MRLESGVEVGDVRGVVLIVVNPHRLFVDMRFQRLIVVG